MSLQVLKAKYTTGIEFTSDIGTRFRRHRLKGGEQSVNNVFDFFNVIRSYANDNIDDEVEIPFVTLRFSNAQFRDITLASFDEFVEELDNVLFQTPTFGSDTVEDGSELEFDWFQIRFFQFSGGSYNNKNIKSDFFKIKNPRSSNNNCVIACFKSVTGCKTRVDKIRDDLLKKYGIPKGVLIPYTLIPKLEQYFNYGCNVISEPNEVLYPSDYDKSFNMLLKDRHYCIITGQKKKKRKRTPPKKELLLFFDLETIFDNNNKYFLKPYSCSWFVWDKEEDFNYNQEHFKQAHFETEKPLRKLLDFIFQCPKGYTYKLVGFNNSKFDNYFLASAACEEGDLTKLFYVNNSILDMRIKGCNTLDVCRFLMTSLKKACESFNTSPKKMEGFNHEVPQAYFERGKLKEWIKDNYTLFEKYNKLDVLCLCDLTVKLYKSIKEKTCLDFTKYMTIGQMGYEYWITNLKHEISYVENYEDDLFIRKSIYGGRTQAFYGRNKLEGNIRMVDVKSLYPFVMINRLFPTGDYFHTDKYVKGKMGVYSCKIKHQNMEWVDKSKINFPKGYETKYAPVVIPRRTKDKPLDWNYRGELYAEINSVDIECIRRSGGEVDVFKGIYWKESIKDMYTDYLTPFMNEKNKQDRLKGTDEYNPALREFCKLASNSLSGKMCQRNFVQIFDCIRTKNQYNKFIEKIVPKTFKEFKYGKHLTFCEGTLQNESDCFKGNTKPSYLGSFIYSYAREYMYDTILSKYFTFYMDTDSSCTTLDEYNRMRINRPDLFGTGEYGCLEEEVGEATMVISISPKNYMVFNPNDESKCKRRFKGVNLNRDRWVRVVRSDVVSKTKTNHYIQFKGQVVNVNDLETEDRRDMMEANNKCGSDEMYETLLKGDKICVFSSHLRKCKDISGEPRFEIQQMYLRKIIN